MKGLWSTVDARPRRAAAALLLAALVLVPSCSSPVPAVQTSSTEPARERTPSLLEQRALDWEKRLGADPGLEVCRLVIPRIGLSMPVLQMIEDAVLDKGLGHWPETPLPGLKGQMVISGHRSTYGSPFRRLGELLPGDTVTVILPYAVVEYEVARVMIVGPDDVEVVRSRGLEELGLTTCHPPGSEEYRLVVQARAVVFSVAD